MADAVSSAETSGRPPEGPPGRFRRGSSGGVGSCRPAKAGSWWPPKSLSSPRPGDGALRLIPPAFTPPTAHQASWLWPPSRPWLCLQSPPGKAGEEAQRAQNSGCPRSQVFARAVRDRQACREFGACGAGGSSRVGRQAGGGSWGCLPRLLNPAETTVLPAQARRCIRHLLPVCTSAGDKRDWVGPWLMTGLTLGKGCPAEGQSLGEAVRWSVELGRNLGCAQLWPPGNSSCHAPASPPSPSLAQLVSWPGSGWGRLEEPGIAQPGQRTSRMKGTMFISLKVLGDAGESFPWYSFAEAGWSHFEGGDFSP